MSETNQTREAYARYLRVLGLTSRAPGLEALDEIVMAHATRVPFENVSKLLYRGERAMRLPPLGRFLDGIEHLHFGGTCYANNSHLAGLLSHLGYDVRLCGADMKSPDVHLVSVVTLADGEHLVDVGYGAPFLASLPLYLDHETAVALGRDRWVLHPRGADGRSRVELLRDGAPRHGYSINPAPRRINEFGPIIESSFGDGSTFMNSVVVARFARGRSTVLQNLSLIESTVDSCCRSDAAANLAALPAAIERLFGMDHELVARALVGIHPERDVWD